MTVRTGYCLPKIEMADPIVLKDGKDFFDGCVKT